MWVHTVQSVCVTGSERHHEYSKKVYDALKENRFRVKLDDRNERVGYKIRDNELNKIPYMLVIGDKEIESNRLSVRHRLQQDLEQMTIDDFLTKVSDERRLRQ